MTIFLLSNQEERFSIFNFVLELLILLVYDIDAKKLR